MKDAEKTLFPQVWSTNFSGFLTRVIYLSFLIHSYAMKLMNFGQQGDKMIYVFDQCAPEQVANAVGHFMLREGYRLEQGNPMNATYGIGNKTMRILFGAFVKRYAFQVYVMPNNSGVTLEFSKGMSGFSGGVIGIAKLNTEFNRISKVLAGIS